MYAIKNSRAAKFRCVHAPQREIKVAIKYDHYKHAPGEPLTYRVLTTDTKGRPVPCEVSFGVVDESIYALREDRPRALQDAFYPRRYNYVQTSFSFEPEYLGDADKGEPKIEARRKFLDTAFWQPDVHTDAHGRATVSFDLPDNLTTWRATAVAQSLSTAFGRETNKVLVAKDFFVRLDTPRILTQNDQTRLTAFIHNGTNKPQTANVRLGASGVNVDGDLTQVLQLQPNEVGQVSWPVAAQSTLQAKLRLTAWTNNAPQLTDGIETSLPIRPRGREQLTSRAGEVSSNKVQSIALHLDKDSLPATRNFTIRVTPSPLASLRDALKYLLGYPYGCVEQTLSRFLPDILVQRLFRLSHLNDKETNRMRAQLPLMVRDSLTRLYRMQHESGAWGWWENDEDDAAMTAYVLYGLSLTRDEGYDVSPEVLSRGRKAAAQMAKKAKGQNVFLIYSLALAGDMKTASTLRKEIKTIHLDAQNLAWLVLLDKQLGNDTAPSFSVLSQCQFEDGNLMHWKLNFLKPTGYTAVDANGELWDERTATAAGLRAMLAHNPKDARVGKVLRWLMLQRADNYWEGTLDTSMVIAALCDYFQARPQETRATGDVLIRCNDKLLQTIKLDPALRHSSDVVVKVPQANLRTGRNDVTVERRGGTSPVFFTALLRQTLPEQELTALKVGGLEVRREYLRLAPKRLGEDRWSLHAEPTNNALKQGDRVRVRLTINAPRDLNYVIIEDPFPSGCEATERGEAEASGADWDNWWSNTDVRDDRIAFFARTLKKGKHVIEYNLRAQTPGTYWVLPSLVQAMYVPAMRAESGEAKVEIQ